MNFQIGQQVTIRNTYGSNRYGNQIATVTAVNGSQITVEFTVKIAGYDFLKVETFHSDKLSA